jgi:hypothetical protein
VGEGRGEGLKVRMSEKSIHPLPQGEREQDAE